MKRFLLIHFLTVVCAVCHAGTNTVQLQNDDETRGERKPRVFTPTATYDDNSVYLRTDSGAVAAHVTITGTSGTVMYSGTTVITPSVQVISAPNIAGEEKYMIEITTDKRRLYGYFM